MSDVRIAYVIVIGLILMLAAIVNVGAKKIGRVICVGGESDKPDYDPDVPPANPMEDEAEAYLNRRPY
jgi:hypothetical protein